MNVPKLRFKEFSDEWQTHKLKDFFSKITEKNKSNSIHNVISNSAKFGLVKQIDYFSKDIANDNNIEGYFIIKTNDFVYNPRKSSEAPFGPICKYNYIEAGIVSPLYLCFRYSQPINYNFFEYLFKSPVWYKYIYQNGDSGARHDRVNIKDNTFFLMPISIPQSKEQQKIADFLSTVDIKIENLNATIENLEQQKKGLMQQIFSQKLRFKDENGNDYPQWKEKKLGELCLKIGDGLHATPKYINNGSNYFINGNNLSNKKIIVNELTKKVSTNELSKYYIPLNNNSILISINGTIGNLAFYNNETIILGKSCGYINLKDDIIREFIYYYLSQFKIQLYFYKELTGTTIKNLSLVSLKNTPIKLPCLEEQTKIADFLSVFDRKIDNQKSQLEHWQQIKKGLLQQMFI